MSDFPEERQRQRHTAELHQIQRAIAGLCVYQDIFSCEIGVAFIELLQAIGGGDLSQGNNLICLRAYGRFFRALATARFSWAAYIVDRLLLTENPFSLQVQTTPVARLSPALVSAVAHDLQSLQLVYTYGRSLPQWMQQVSGWQEIPQIDVGEVELAGSAITTALKTREWGELVGDLAAHYQQFGVGIFGRYRAMRWRGELIGIAHPDRIHIDDLVGYEAQKQTLIANTQALLAGKPALNVLLYGGKGTGKSSLVKGLLNYFSGSQLRTIEVSKSATIDLPLILDRLTDLPQKFIIFIDELSFEADDEAFKALKAVLEGGLTARPANVVVYATSNRRHLVREYFADRPRPQDADEIHMWDTTQEKLSFSDRFGIALTFEPADQAKYLEIVRHLAASAQLPIACDALEASALQWATRHHGRSGRTARQFIDYLLGTGGKFPAH